MLVIHFCPSPGCNQRKWIPTLLRHRPLRPPTPAIPSYRATTSSTTASSFLFIPALSPRPRPRPSNILSVRYLFRNLAAPVELSCQPLEVFPSTRPVRFGIFLLAFLFLLSCLGSLACFFFFRIGCGARMCPAGGLEIGLAWCILLLLPLSFMRAGY